MNSYRAQAGARTGIDFASSLKGTTIFCERVVVKNGDGADTDVAFGTSYFVLAWFTSPDV
jgi:hypothetical protein